MINNYSPNFKIKSRFSNAYLRIECITMKIGKRCKIRIVKYRKFNTITLKSFFSTDHSIMQNISRFTEYLLRVDTLSKALMLNLTL